MSEQNMNYRADKFLLEKRKETGSSAKVLLPKNR